MSAPTPRRLSASQRIAFIAGGLGAFLIALVIGSWYVLPVIAPQFVIRNSPWVDPIIRAEVSETGGIDTYTWDPSKPPPPERIAADERINNEDFIEAEIPPVVAALSDPDVRVRRVALQMLEPLLEYDDDEFITLSPAMLAALYPLLQDADEYVFRYTFNLLVKHNSDETARHIFTVLPRACDPKKLTGGPDDIVSWGYFFSDSEDSPRTLRILSRLDLVNLTKSWLDTNEKIAVMRALFTLSFSNDPAVYQILSDNLGRWRDISQRGGPGFDPVVSTANRLPLGPFTKTICDALEGADQERRLSAAELVASLSRNGDEKLRALQWNLIRKYRDDSNNEIREAIAVACVCCLTTETVETDLVPILNKGGKSAITAIDVLGTWYFLPQRPRPWIRTYASCRKKWDDPGNPELVAAVTTALSRFVTHSDVKIRRAVAHYMNNTWEAETIDAINTLAHDEDAEVREAVAWSVDDLKGRHFTPATEPTP